MNITSFVGFIAEFLIKNSRRTHAHAPVAPSVMLAREVGSGRSEGAKEVWAWHFGRKSGKNHGRKSKIHTADAINEITSL